VPTPEQLLRTYDGRDELLLRFRSASGRSKATIAHELVPPPPDPRDLAQRFATHQGGAVYVQCLAASFVKDHPCDAGAGRALRVGSLRPGPYGGAIFCGSHGRVRGARGPLAWRLLERPVLWPYLGIGKGGLSAGTAERRIAESTDRIHFFPVPDDPELRLELATYLRGVLGPVVEG
jgi:hypothetical protein